MTGWLCSFRDGSVVSMAFSSAVNAASAGNDLIVRRILGAHLRASGSESLQKTRESQKVHNAQAWDVRFAWFGRHFHRKPGFEKYGGFSILVV